MFNTGGAVTGWRDIAWGWEDEWVEWWMAGWWIDTGGEGWKDGRVSKCSSVGGESGSESSDKILKIKIIRIWPNTEKNNIISRKI